MRNQTTLLATFSLLGLTGCFSEHPAAPACRIDSRFEENISGNGVCIIRLNDKLVTISRRTDDGYTLPFADTTVNNNAQCHAHSNAWNSTGFNVQVGKFLGVSRTNKRLYECTLDTTFPPDFTEFSVPSFVDDNVQSIQLISPFSITPSQWTQRDELITIRSFFTQLNG